MRVEGRKEGFSVGTIKNRDDGDSYQHSLWRSCSGLVVLKDSIKLSRGHPFSSREY